MPGLNGYEFIILGVLAVVLLGPERLPVYAQTLARWVRQARSKAEDAKEYFREETGTDFDEVDWKRYDPRQYDPRRIVREALAEDYEETRRAVSEVRDSARITGGRRGAAAGSRTGTGSTGSGGSRGASGASASGASAGASGASPASTRSGVDDPRAVFGGVSAATGAAMAAGAAGAASRATADAAGESASGASAMAAGMVGAGVQPRSTTDGDAVPEVPGLRPAPFDVDAT